MSNYTVCAIIVTYNPTRVLIENVAALRGQVSRIVIVDNGSGDASMAYIDEARSMFGCDVILNGRNFGIAVALNIGVRCATSRNCDWVVLFDQDSSVVGSFIASMLRAYEEYETPEAIAIVAPRYIDRVSSTPWPVTTDRSNNILTSMTSGSLIPVRIFRDCGAFNESLFMDYVDHEFCLRVRSMGFVIVQSKMASLLHSLGEMTVYGLLGRKIVTTNHSAERRYYITRNRIWLCKKYICKDFSWTVRDAWGMIADTGRILLLERDRALKLRNMLLGIRDALSGAIGSRMPL